MPQMMEISYGSQVNTKYKVSSILVFSDELLTELRDTVDGYRLSQYKVFFKIQRKILLSQVTEGLFLTSNMMIFL